jgi:hypothetical protein
VNQDQLAQALLASGPEKTSAHTYTSLLGADDFGWGNASASTEAMLRLSEQARQQTSIALAAARSARPADTGDLLLMRFADHAARALGAATQTPYAALPTQASLPANLLDLPA